jgi:hypothetical protein
LLTDVVGKRIKICKKVLAVANTLAYYPRVQIKRNYGLLDLSIRNKMFFDVEKQKRGKTFFLSNKTFLFFLSPFHSPMLQNFFRPYFINVCTKFVRGGSFQFSVMKAGKAVALHSRVGSWFTHTH